MKCPICIHLQYNNLFIFEFINYNKLKFSNATKKKQTTKEKIFRFFNFKLSECSLFSLLLIMICKSFHHVYIK